MKWIESNGGSLICLPKTIISSWGGIEFLSTASIRETVLQNDYKHACSFDSYLECITVINGDGLVLGGEPSMTGVFPKPRSGIQVVRIIYCNSFEDIEAAIPSGRDNSQAKEIESLSFDAQEPEWCTFDSAFPGSLIRDDGLVFAMPTGNLRIRTFDYQSNQDTSLIVHDFDIECHGL